MAVAFDAVSSSSVGTGGLSWTHTPTGDPAGILVLIASRSTDQVSGVTYGGVALREVYRSPTTRTFGSGVSGTAYAYFLGAGIPTGGQTVEVTVTGSANKCAVCYSVTADTHTDVTTVWATAGSVNGGTNPGDDHRIDQDAFLSGVFMYSQTATEISANGSHSTQVEEQNLGYSDDAANWIRRTSVGSAGGTATLGWTITTNGNAARITVGISETGGVPAYDATSNGAFTGTSFSWTHTPTGTPKGVVVYVIQNGSNTDAVTSVTYGGQAMELVRTVSNSSGAFARLYAFFLENPLAGARTVQVNTTSLSVTRRGRCISFTSDADSIVVSADDSLVASTSTPAVSITLPKPAFLSGALWANQSTPPSSTDSNRRPEAYRYLEATDLGSQFFEATVRVGGHAPGTYDYRTHGSYSSGAKMAIAVAVSNGPTQIAVAQATEDDLAQGVLAGKGIGQAIEANAAQPVAVLAGLFATIGQASESHLAQIVGRGLTPAQVVSTHIAQAAGRSKRKRIGLSEVWYAGYGSKRSGTGPFSPGWLEWTHTADELCQGIVVFFTSAAKWGNPTGFFALCNSQTMERVAYSADNNTVIAWFIPLVGPSLSTRTFTIQISTGSSTTDTSARGYALSVGAGTTALRAYGEANSGFGNWFRSGWTPDPPVDRSFIVFGAFQTNSNSGTGLSSMTSLDLESQSPFGIVRVARDDAVAAGGTAGHGFTDSGGGSWDAVFIAIAEDTAIEHDEALPLAGTSKSALLGQPVGTHTAQPVEHTKQRTPGQVVEGDTAQAVVRRKSMLFAQAVASDVAFALAAAKSAGVERADEAETAQAVASLKTKMVDGVVEADLAASFSVSKSASADQAAETDAPQAIDRSKAVEVVLIASAEEAQALGSTKALQVAVAAEAEVAGALGSSKSSDVDMASEADAALSVDALKRAAISMPVSMEEAQAVVSSKARQVGATVESDAVQGTSPARTIGVDVGLEVDTAHSVARVKLRAVDAPEEVDVPRPVSGSKSDSTAQVVETGSAQAASSQKSRQVVATVETSQSHTVVWSKATATMAASEGDESSAIGAAKSVLVPRVDEGDVAHEAVSAKARPAGQSASSEEASPVGVSRGAAIALAEDSGSVFAVGRRKSFEVAVADEGDDAIAAFISIGRYIADVVSLDLNLAAGVGLGVSDDAALSDGTSFAPEASLSDGVAVADALGVSVDVELADGVAVADVVSASIGLGVGDGLVLGDLTGYGVALGVTDGVDAADEVSFGLGLWVADAVVTADILSLLQLDFLSSRVALVEAVSDQVVVAARVADRVSFVLSVVQEASAVDHVVDRVGVAEVAEGRVKI